MSKLSESIYRSHSDCNGSLVPNFSGLRGLGEWLVDPATPEKLNKIWESDPKLCVGHRYLEIHKAYRPLQSKGNLWHWVELVRLAVNPCSYGYGRDGTTLWNVLGVAARTPDGAAPWLPGREPSGSRWSEPEAISMARDHMAEIGAIIYTASILDQELVAAAREKYGFGRAGEPPVENSPVVGLMAYDLGLTGVSDLIAEAARKSPCHSLASGSPARKLAFPTDGSALQFLKRSSPYFAPAEGSVYRCGEHWHITTT